MEVMVGFTIISIVLGVIFSSLYQETFLKKKIEKIEDVVMAHMAVQQFLDRVFASHITMDPQSSKKSLYTTDGLHPELVILFDNGADPSPLFSGEIKGVLCVEEGALVFKLHEGKSCARTTVLRKGIEDLSFEFLTNGTHGIESSSTWDESYNFPPSFVKITLNQKEDYAFWVNQSCEGIPLNACTKGKQ